jgi:hypothetical protein
MRGHGVGFRVQAFHGLGQRLTHIEKPHGKDRDHKPRYAMYLEANASRPFNILSLQFLRCQNKRRGTVRHIFQREFCLQAVQMR